MRPISAIKHAALYSGHRPSPLLADACGTIARGTKTFTRREMMRMSAGALLAAGVWPGALRAAEKETKAFRFVEVNDLHLVDEGCLPWFTKLFAEINGLDPLPERLLIVGDLTDKSTPEAVGMMRDLLKPMKMPVHVVPGNHDHHATDGRKHYEEVFKGQTNYVFDHNGWQFVAMDTCDAQKFEKVSCLKENLEAARGLVAKLDKQRPTVLFTHFPVGDGVKYQLVNAEDVLGLFREVNLRAVYDGHYHAYTEKVKGDFAVTTNHCCSFKINNHDGTKEKGYFLCTAGDGVVKRESVVFKGV